MRRTRSTVIAISVLTGAGIFFTQVQSDLSRVYQAPWKESNLGNFEVVPSQAPSSTKLASTYPPPSTGPSTLDHVADLLPSSIPERQPSSTHEPPLFQAEFPFQNDLSLEVPVRTLSSLATANPHNYSPDGPRTYTYATFMATQNPSLKDPYYLAIHSLIYRVLWSPHSRTSKYPFVVFVADFVTLEQRQLLAGAGAIVRELSALEWNPNVPGIQHRWRDLFAKLNMWNETEFERIIFLDADAFPLTNIDAMFDIAPVQKCVQEKLHPDDYLADGTPVCEPYIFAGVPQNPFDTSRVNINVGSMVFTPSKRMHQRLLQNYVKTDRYDCLMAEQAFLNWQFDSQGAFPPTLLEREWGGFFPKQDEEGKLKVVHEKLWVEKDGWMKKEWEFIWQEMWMFYNGDDFRRIRTG
ncbi:nucleotide-diphospho-sugar transferase [Dendryphion nanum]|uniref:Nucleotide-diphospho-sugar transferase n=1 Tax=Dendryphion nanum TaxID=256645 RepID=A0A9P9E980_9PLEO|nr:nucleotide-diphospho-sugar transferase [Dendryphion nanum]